MALFHLRSYQSALDELQPAASSSDANVQALLRQLIECVMENCYGQYDIAKIREEAKDNPRLSHADYCSDFIEVLPSDIGGKGGRGIFATKDIPAGTLLVAATAVDCVFSDEIQEQREYIPIP